MQASMIAWVVTYLLHSTILVLGAWLLERRWSDRPERMSAVWKTALVGGLVTATVQTGLGIAPAAGRWELSTELATAGEPAEAVTAPVGEHVLAAAGPSSSSPAPDWAGGADEHAVVRAGGAQVEHAALARVGGEDEPVLAATAAAAPVAATAAVAAPAAAVSASASSSPWATMVPWVLAVLAFGALLGLISVLMAFAALRRQLRGRHAVSEGTLAVLLDGLRRRAGVPCRVPLTVAPRVRVPMAVGVLRPEIVVPPQAARSLAVAHQESLLAHELAHVLRRDPAWRLVALLAERVFFFQPLNRLASRRLAQTAEYLCDDWAARHTRQPLALASCLTEIATWVARPGPVAATMAGPRSILGRRVQRLLQPAPASIRPRWLTAALALPLVAVVAAAPGVDARAAKPRRGEPAPIVVIDDAGRRHEVQAPEGGAVVVHERGGQLHVQPLDGDQARRAGLVQDDPPPRRDARKATRDQERARDKARRQARKDLRRAFREAKQRGDAAPSRGEVEAILRRARKAGGHEEARPHPREPGHMEVRVVVPGEIAVHGRVPLDLEGLELLEGLEDLGPVLEQIQRELEESGIDVVIEHRRGAAKPKLRVGQPIGHPMPPSHARARARHEEIRARQEAERAIHRAAREQAREQLRRQHEHGPDAEQIRREVEQIRRRIERAQQEERRRAPATELPTVWNHVAPPAPPAPPAARSPRAAPAPRVPAPPAAPPSRVAPAPRAPVAPPPHDSPVVWVSLPLDHA